MSVHTASAGIGRAVDPLVVSELRAIVGDRHVLTDPSIIADHLIDWTGRYRAETGVLVRPGSTAEVAAIVLLCERNSVAIVPQGGNTGLVGGGVAGAGEMTLSMRRFDEIGEIDQAALQITVGAGVTLAALQEKAAASGLAFGVDLAPRLSCTVGGMIATNAGGINVVRHGMMRRQVLGLEAVLGGGAVVSRLNGLVKDNTGYDLSGLLIGSEGTLGVVTRARLSLVPAPDFRLTAALGFASAADAVTAVGSLRRALPDIEALEFMTADGVALAARHRGVVAPAPFLAPFSLLIDVAGHGRGHESDLAEDVSEIIGGVPVVGEPAVAASSAQRATMWAIRESHTEAIRSLGIPIKLDVSVPLPGVGEFLDRVVGAVPAEHRCIVFGHLGDANLHVNIVGPRSHEPGIESATTDAVLRLVIDLGGSISAEHGIGKAKARHLAWYRSDAEMQAFRAIKAALDPSGVFNPHVLLAG